MLFRSNDSLAEVETRAEREPSTGACGDASSFEQSASAPIAPEDKTNELLDAIISHANSSRKIKKQIVIRLAEAGLIVKAKKAKSVKRVRKQVSTPVVND